MFSFSISPTVFNLLIKRLLPLVGSDKNAVLTLLINKDLLDIFYHSTIDKSDSNGIFYEQLPITSREGIGSVSFLASSLLNIKIPEFISEKKFPFSKEIDFTIGKTNIDIQYRVFWDEDRHSNTKLQINILTETDKLEIYEKLFLQHTKFVEFCTADFIRGISFCNFIKADATSKESNGYYLRLGCDNALYLISTDSNIAIKYKCEVDSNTVTDLSLVISNQTLNYIRTFINDSETFKLSPHRNSLYIETNNRKMLVPIMGRNFIIDNPDQFFDINDPKISILEVKPLYSFIQMFVVKATDLYKRLILDFTHGKFNIKSETDYVEGLPSEILKDCKIQVNGDFLTTCCSRIQQLDPKITLYYNVNTQRITLATDDQKVVFLIQGISN